MDQKNLFDYTEPWLDVYFSTTRKDVAQATDPSAWPFQKATQKQISYVYWLGSRAGYSGRDVHDWHPSHMDKGEIEVLIRKLQEEAGIEDDDETRERRLQRDGLY